MQKYNRNFRSNGRKPFKKRGDKRNQDVPFDVLLRRFKKKVERSGLMKDLRAKEFYESKGEKERRKKKEGKRRWEKAMRTNPDYQFSTSRPRKRRNSKHA